MTKQESTLPKEEQQKHIAELLKKMGMSAIDIEQDFVNYLYNNLGRNLSSDCFYKYRALSYTMRDRLMTHWKQTWLAYNQKKRVKLIIYRWSF